MVGVILFIFVLLIFMFFMTFFNVFFISSWVVDLNNLLILGYLLYNIIYVVLNIFFCYFYIVVIFNFVDVVDNLKKYGGFILGICAGKKIAEYIDCVFMCIIFGGAVYILVVCVLFIFLMDWYNVLFYFGGISLLIVVGVVLDTVQ